MREIDRRTWFSRRGLGAGREGHRPHAMATLVKAARDILPRDHSGDLFHVRAVTPWDAKAGKDDAVKAMLAEGVARLDGDAHDAHA